MSSSDKRIVLRSKIEELAEIPVVEVLIDALQSRLDQVNQERSERMIWDDPVRTHIDRANLIGKEEILKDMILILQADEEVVEYYLEDAEVELLDDIGEEDGSEYERSSSGWREDTSETGSDSGNNRWWNRFTGNRS